MIKYHEFIMTFIHIIDILHARKQTVEVSENFFQAQGKTMR